MAPLPAPAEKPSHRVSDSQSHAKVRPPAQVAVFCAALRPNLQPALTPAGRWICRLQPADPAGPEGRRAAAARVLLEPCQAPAPRNLRQQRLGDRSRGPAPDRRALCHRGRDPLQHARTPARRTTGTVRASRPGLRRLAPAAARPRLAQVPARREARLYRPPLGRPPTLPRRRTRRDGQQQCRESRPADCPVEKKRVVRRPRRRRRRMGTYRLAHRDGETKSRRALRLAQGHSRSPSPPGIQTAASTISCLGTYRTRQAEIRVLHPYRLRTNEHSHRPCRRPRLGRIVLLEDGGAGT